MPLVALFVIAIVSLVIVRIGAIALMMTGLSRDVADFQSVSCFFGVGFTTNEAEMIVSHPVRRRIAIHLIIAGNIGLTGALGTLIVTFMSPDPDWFEVVIRDRLGVADHWQFWLKVLSILMGILLILLVFRVRLIKHVIEAAIKSTLSRSGVVRAMDYETLLRARDGYCVSEYEIDPRHPLVGRTLEGVGLGHRGVLVLGIFRSDGSYVGAPDRTTRIHAGDVLTVYGKEAAILTALSPD